MSTEKRLNRFQDVINNKQMDLTVICDRISDPHNISAVMRTCESVGVNEIHVINSLENPILGKKSSASANKWIDVYNYKSYYQVLKKINTNYQIISTVLDKNATSIYDLDLTKPTAIVLGNEHSGISEEMQLKSNIKAFIPMFGLVQSLNVSVAASVILYESLRQRLNNSFYPNKELDLNWKNEKLKEWIKK